MTRKPIIPYEEIGPETLSKLVDAFYEKVAAHPLLKPIFPDDLTETARKQKQFLTQYLGGPNIYSQEHGHPMLRARHIPFPITPDRAQAWLECMAIAMDDYGLRSTGVYFIKSVNTCRNLNKYNLPLNFSVWF